MEEGLLGHRLRTYRSVPLPQYRTVPLGVVICVALNFTWPVPAFILHQSSSYMHVVFVFNLEIVLQQVHREAIYFVYQLHTSILHVLNCKTLISSKTEYVQMYNLDVFCDKGNLILSSYVAESMATWLQDIWPHRPLSAAYKTEDFLAEVTNQRFWFHQTFRQLTAAFISGNGLQSVCVLYV